MAAGRLLYACTREDALSMELSVSAETGDDAWRFDTPLYRMTVDGRRVVAAERSGMTFWYCDGLVYLDNGRAWAAGNIMPDHLSLLEDTIALFRASEVTRFESPGEKIYTIDADSAAASYTRCALPRRVSCRPPAGRSAGKRCRPAYRRSFSCGPARRRRSCWRRSARRSPRAAPPRKSRMRTRCAWLRLNAAEPLDADVVLTASCGPLVLNDRLEWYRYHADGAEIDRIRKNDLTLYYSGGAVTGEDGAAASDVPDEPAAAVLLRLAHRLCMFGEPAVEERDGAVVYSLALDESEMAQVFETVLPEGGALDVALTQGKVLVTLSGNWIESVRFSASGDAHVLGASAPASLSAELRFAVH